VNQDKETTTYLNSTNSAGNVNKEPVCEVVNRNKFFKILKIINPTLSNQEVNIYFVRSILYLIL
jgi:hypothetical protein